MFGEFSPFQANAIRMLAAVIFIWVWTAFGGRIGATFAALRDKPRVIGLIALGAVMGPLLGVSASLLAVQHAEVGVASTLMALPPVIILPISYFALKERIGRQFLALYSRSWELLFCSLPKPIIEYGSYDCYSTAAINPSEPKPAGIGVTECRGVRIVTGHHHDETLDDRACSSCHQYENR
jgi:hypothetical protein